ncbi:MAG: hypothetical protein IT429_12710 [Gemmataceae bacterium]|nr:hypothetical protein [Gemmataceae bacterium]
MTRPALSPVEQQLRRVRRRLVVQTLLDRLAWCWAGALALAAGWFLLQPLVLPEAEEWVRWAVAGGLAAAATVLAVVLTRLAAPSRLGAALELDERFGLKERVTTSLSLGADQEALPAAQALLADVNRHVAGLHVPTRFPVRLTWPAALVPACAAVLVLLAFFYQPGPGSSAASTDDVAKRQTANPEEIKNKLDELKKLVKKESPKDEPKSKEMKELEKAWEKLLGQKIDPNDKEQVRELVQAMRPLEEKIKERLADLKARTTRGKQLKDRLKDLKGMQPKDGKFDKDAPGKEFEDALARGDLEKAAQELDRLRKTLDENQLNNKERRQLEERLANLADKLKRLADLEGLQKKLEEALNKLTPEERKQLEEQMRKDMEELAREMGDLKELADQLEQCLECMKKGGKLGKMQLGQKLKELKGKLAKLDIDPKDLKEMDDLKDQQQCLGGACQAMLLGLMNGNGMGQGGPPGTKRPIAKDGDTDHKNAAQKADLKDDVPLRITGFRKGGTFAQIPAREVGTAFRQAQQEAPTALERQRVPPDAADLYRGYFENLGGQK